MRRSGINAELVSDFLGAVFDSFAEVRFELGPVADHAGIDRAGMLLRRHRVHLGGGDERARFGYDADPTAAPRGLGVALNSAMLIRYAYRKRSRLSRCGDVAGYVRSVLSSIIVYRVEDLRLSALDRDAPIIGR